MEFTLKNYEIIDARYAIKEILKIKDLDTKFNWNLIKNLKKLESSLKTFSECEMNLLKKYALKDEEGKIRIYEEDATDGIHKKGDIKFPPKMEEEYKIKQAELMNCEDTLSLLTIDFDLLPKKMGEGNLLQCIEFMIVDPSDVNEPK